MVVSRKALFHHLSLDENASTLPGWAATLRLKPEAKTKLYKGSSSFMRLMWSTTFDLLVCVKIFLGESKVNFPASAGQSVQFNVITDFST